MRATYPALAYVGLVIALLSLVGLHRLLRGITGSEGLWFWCRYWALNVGLAAGVSLLAIRGLRFFFG